MHREILPISCLGSCYVNTSAIELEESIQSLFADCWIPDQVVLVIDGKITSEVEECILRLIHSSSIDIVRMRENQGLGGALAIGLKKCIHDIVVRYDTDDISEEGRIITQWQFLEKNKDISVVGANVNEISSHKEQSKGKTKRLPINSNTIRIASNFINPINHPSAAFRKSHVLNSDSYKPMPYFEDYYLWLRMIKRGFNFANIDKTLVTMKRKENLGIRT